MIRNLNAITFREFGAVMSERPQNSKNIEKEAGTLLALDGKHAVVYQAKEQTMINTRTILGLAGIKVMFQATLIFWFQLVYGL